MPPAIDPRILVDASTRDDAAVVRLAPNRALVATVDFFSPIVDSPYDFGRIAAANALSDVYAMGGTPFVALSVVGWPRDTLSFDLLGEVLRGAAAVVRDAGAFIVGGHSVDDPEPKFGLVALGEVDPTRIVTNAGARAGDVLVLTKPLGTGVLATALKRDLVTEADLAPAVAVMTTLNAGAARAMVAVGANACTDVTGFGLLGHLQSLLRASGVAAELEARAVPVLARARELAEGGAVPGGTQRNLDAVTEAVEFGALDRLDRLLFCDPQTSGGLLIAVAPENADALVAALAREHTPVAARIGRVVPGAAGTVRIR